MKVVLSFAMSLTLSGLCVWRPGPYDVLYLGCSWLFTGANLMEWLNEH